MSSPQSISLVPLGHKSLMIGVIGWLCFNTIDARAQQGYGSYYGQNVTQSHGQLGTQSTTRYLYDEYFYKRPSVSAYQNIDRLDTMSGTAYQSYVRPEQQRREARAQTQRAYIDQRKKEGRVGETRYPGAIMKPQSKPVGNQGAYHNHWYGSWAK
jgi:hypothetical protein